MTLIHAHTLVVMYFSNFNDDMNLKFIYSLSFIVANLTKGGFLEERVKKINKVSHKYISKKYKKSTINPVVPQKEA